MRDSLQLAQEFVLQYSAFIIDCPENETTLLGFDPPVRFRFRFRFCPGAEIHLLLTLPQIT